MRALRSAPWTGVHIFRPRHAWIGVLGFLALCSAGGVNTPAAETRWIFLKAREAKERLQINVCGSDRTYYRLDTVTPVEFSATGPTRIKLITRHLDSVAGAPRAAYSIRVARGAGEQTILLKEIIAEEGEGVLCSATGEAVGEGEESVIYAPRGKWHFKIYLHEGDTAVAVRLLQEEQVRHRVLVHCAPQEYERILVLVQPSGNEYPHYHFTRQQPLRVSLRGPAPVSIRTRLDFAAGGRERAPYGIEVIGWQRRDGQLREGFRQSAHYWSRRLEKARYRETSEILPGENIELAVDLPAGDWILEMHPIDEEIAGAAARVLAPKRALTNGASE